MNETSGNTDLKRSVEEMNDALLVNKLDRMLVLLREHNEPHWHAYLQEAAALFAADKPEQKGKKGREKGVGLCSL